MTVTKEELKEFKKFAEHLALESGRVIKPYFFSDLSVQTKDDSTPVTAADRKAEELIRNLIEKHFPNHGIIGEEFGKKETGSEYTWVLDPIDGTKSFIAKMITFGTLIALLKNGKPVLGVINQPVLEELLIGDNFTCELNGIKTTVRQCDSLNKALLLTTDHLNVYKYKNGKKFEKLIREVRLYRTWGNSYGYYLLATGRADAMIDPIMSPWDLLPLIPIIKGAGGIITDYEGRDPVKGDSTIAAAPGIHGKIIQILN